MRYTAFVVLPYIVFTAVFAFGFFVIQRDERRSCDNQRAVYHILSSGMRRRAIIADAYPIPHPKNGTTYGEELRREAGEIEKIQSTITGCAAR